ncbi:hypothetical protein [Vibrio gangliei]|uniref:hypothetical protein n=1 Tax=Vibrio gangliei TaxID=2077090 RepID=UPI000D01FE9A|nr:hypothetical protein [Vibrio gangliei]
MALFKRKHKAKITQEVRKLTFEDLLPEKLSSLVKSGESFEVIALGGNMLEATKRIEHAIETEGLRCRVYTIGRVAACGLSLAGGVTALVGAGAIAGIMYHNLYTYNPDYKIGKDLVNNQLLVEFKSNG